MPVNAGGTGLIPDWGVNIPCALWPKKKTIKQKQYSNRFNKDFKNGPHIHKKFFKKIKSKSVQGNNPQYQNYLTSQNRN